MSGLLPGLGLARPEGMAALAALLVLVLVWLRERRRRDLDVPSLLLWETVKEDSSKRRFRPEPLFFLQALALGVLALALAKPFTSTGKVSGEGHRAVLVLDTSASMKTREAGSVRFERARKLAVGLLDELGKGAEVMILAADSSPRVVLAATKDLDLARRTLETIQPTDGLSRLGFALQLARSSRVPGTFEIAVFTDLPPESVSISAADADRVRAYHVGGAAENVAVTALAVERSPFEREGGISAYAVVHNFGRKPRAARFHASLEGEKLLDQSLDLEPGEGRFIPFRRIAGAGRLEVKLDVADDALAADDRALAWVPAPRNIKLLAVLGRGGLEMGLRALAESAPGLDLEIVTPAQAVAAKIETSDVALFYGWAPAEPRLLANSLFLSPPDQAALFPAVREVAGARILDWNERHPLLRDLRYVEALPLARAVELRAPDWMHPVISSSAEGKEFALVLAGEKDGRRAVVVAFDVSGRDLGRSDNLGIVLLLLNSLRWLAPADPGAPVTVPVGTRFAEPLLQPAAFEVVDPSGGSQSREAATHLEMTPNQVGEYHLRAGGRDRAIYANLFDAAESDVARAGDVAREVGGIVAAKTATPQIERDDRTRLVLAALVFLLAAEWLVLALRRRPVEDA